MRRFAIRLAIAVLGLLIASQFLIPVFAEHQVASRLTDHGGSAHVTLRALPALRLLFGQGDKLDVKAHGLSVALSQHDVFKKLDGFNDVSVTIEDSQAGPFHIGAFTLERRADHLYVMEVDGQAKPGDVATYAGSQFGGALGAALGGLAASALGNLDQPLPFGARMNVDTSSGQPQARDVVGDVAGFPAGPLAQVAANALLSGL
jgi:hypothetical protein